MSDANTELLAQMAEALGDLRERIVFVGGCATALLITDPAVAPVRATQDVDAVVAIASLPEYLRCVPPIMNPANRGASAS